MQRKREAINTQKDAALKGERANKARNLLCTEFIFPTDAALKPFIDLVSFQLRFVSSLVAMTTDAATNWSIYRRSRHAGTEILHSVEFRRICMRLD